MAKFTPIRPTVQTNNSNGNKTPIPNQGKLDPRLFQDFDQIDEADGNKSNKEAKAGKSGKSGRSGSKGHGHGRGAGSGSASIGNIRSVAPTFWTEFKGCMDEGEGVAFYVKGDQSDIANPDKSSFFKMSSTYESDNGKIKFACVNYRANGVANDVAVAAIKDETALNLTTFWNNNDISNDGNFKSCIACQKA